MERTPFIPTFYSLLVMRGSPCMVLLRDVVSQMAPGVEEKLLVDVMAKRVLRFSNALNVL